jgi:hypothetical protein
MLVKSKDLTTFFLPRQLVMEYGAGFSEKNLRRMMQFGEAFLDEQIVVSLIRQLTWNNSGQARKVAKFC